MENLEISDMINSLKRLLHEDKIINLPTQGKSLLLDLHSSNYDFLFDINRKGHKLIKCTFQLREINHRSDPLIRFDLIGKAHPNPVGSYGHAGERIPCPHVHMANFPEYGIAVALPINDPMVRLNIPASAYNDILFCLNEILARINVANRDDFRYTLNQELLS